MSQLKISREDIHILAENTQWTKSGADKALKEHVYSTAASWQKFLKILFVSLGAGQTHLNELVFSTNIHYSIRHQASYLSHFSFLIARV
ncbi:MAG: hypothetical protein LBH32_11095 [Dysgonamonadaceae bacterium]|jgi:hypothetical protein|nr:hypothetical protein [Dysgonamonadaceae bacterium]